MVLGYWVAEEGTQEGSILRQADRLQLSGWGPGSFLTLSPKDIELSSMNPGLGWEQSHNQVDQSLKHRKDMIIDDRKDAPEGEREGLADGALPPDNPQLFQGFTGDLWPLEHCPVCP